MVMSELTRGGRLAGLLVFLSSWTKGPYIDPDQQGDTWGKPFENEKTACLDSVACSVLSRMKNRWKNLLNLWHT